MTARVITGSKREIAEKVSKIDGEIREAIVFVEDLATTIDPGPAESVSDIFGEMKTFEVKVGGADDSRGAIYQRMEGE